MINNTQAGLWLLTDMCLHVLALVLVKSIGADYPIMQSVFFRAVVGLVVLLPWIAKSPNSFVHIDNWRLQLARVILSTLALSCGFYAVTHLPLALFTAINYLRPAVLMIMATLLLREWIGPKRWLAAALGFIGVLVAVQPAQFSNGSGLWVLFLAILAGTSATIILRRLKGTPELVMMVFYTLGLAIVSSPFALYDWQSIKPEDWILLIAIGVFAQCAQFCFLRAHWSGDVGFLGPLSYLSLLISASAGFVFFDEVPTLALVIGAGIILMSAVLVNRHRQVPPP